jgi:hypothetical protein
MISDALIAKLYLKSAICQETAYPKLFPKTTLREIELLRKPSPTTRHGEQALGNAELAGAARKDRRLLAQ